MLSPVSADSSTADEPLSTLPSTGMLCPGRTAKTSPTLTSDTGTVSSFPSRIRLAVFGASFISPLSASVVFPFDRASSIFPTVISARIIAADSNHSPCIYPIAASASPLTYASDIAKSSTVLYTNAAPDPSATSVSIFGDRCITPFTPFTKNF